jgi:hypothetical protein
MILEVGSKTRRWLDLMADGARRLVALGVEKDGVIAVH